MNLKQVVLFIVIILFIRFAHAQTALQSPTDTTGVKNMVSGKYLDIVGMKAQKLEHNLDKQTEKALSRFQKQELRLQKKLGKIDSLKAANVFGNAKEKYDQLKVKLEHGSSSSSYIPSLDTLTNSLKFLQQNPELLKSVKGGSDKLKDAMTKVNGMQEQLQKADEIKRFLKERKQYLKEQLGDLPLAKDLKKLSKEVYYFETRLKEYQSLLKEHKKAERKALELLSKTRAFQKFMRKNSQLASLFRMPGDDLSPSGGAGGGSLAGLQTRQQVNDLLQQNIGAAGSEGRQQVTQNLQAAKDQMNQLKDKMLKAGAGNSDEEMPDFKPNQQKTKSFWKRVDLGTNFQSQKANGYFPTTSDIGLSVGYKLNDRSIIGIGSSYKMGWGQNIRHIKVSHQGVGLRSFADWKIKGSFWLSGGYEMNYQSEIESIDVLKDFSAWQQSGLIGLSKVVSLRSKFFKKTKLQLMWDFLSYQQTPKTPPVLFRINYFLNKK